MNLHRYTDICTIAGKWACDGPPAYPMRYANVHLVQSGVGIYIACRSDMRVLYVGSAVRPGNPKGIFDRIRAHPANRRSQWWWFWIVPMVDNTPIAAARGIEGQVIDLLRPLENIRRHKLVLIPPIRSISRDS